MECTTGRFLFDIVPEADQPSDIAVGPNGDLYLVDGVNSRILVIAPSGDRKFSFGRGGRQPGEFLRPLGIDISSGGRVFIADTGNHRIQAFDLTGKFLYQFPVQTGPGSRRKSAKMGHFETGIFPCFHTAGYVI